MTKEATPQRQPREVSKAVIAMIKARSVVHQSLTIAPEAKSGAAELAQEEVLHDLPEEVKAAARAAFEQALQRSQGVAASSSGSSLMARPSLIPGHISRDLPRTEVPPFPEGALDDPDVREEWARAHQDSTEAHFMLEPKVLRAYAEAQLAAERWDAQQGPRKPSGDLKHPVPRDRLNSITREMKGRHKRTIARSGRIANAISSGDVARVEPCEDFGPRFVTLVLKSDLERREAEKAAKANRTPEQVAMEEDAWDELIDGMLAELPPEKPELEIPSLPELPTDRDPTAAEMRSFVNAVRRHIDYVEVGEKIEAKRKADAATKLRTKARLDAEKADPVGTETAKKEQSLSKAADRQRRWRERQKATGPKK